MRPLALLLAAALPLLAQQDPKDKEARDLETVRYRELPEIVDEIAKEAEKGEKTLVVWLIDNATALKASKHGDILSEALIRSFGKPWVHHAVIAFAETPRVVLKPVNDSIRASTAITTLAQQPPEDGVKNCLLNIREAAKLASSFSAPKKFVVLFTPENADNEDDVEVTLKALKGITFVPIVPEAIASDSYWEASFAGARYFASDIEKFRKLPFKLKGPEGPYLEFPYGFPFEWMSSTNTVPSGFAPWAVARLAAQTGGKAYLYTVDRSLKSFCGTFACQLCGGGHKSCGAEYDVTKLKLTEPSLVSRAEYGQRRAKDRLVLANLAAWDHLWREGNLDAAPPVKLAGASLVENVRTEKERPAPRPDSSTEWKNVHADALKRAESVDKAATELLAAEKRHEKESDRRTVAVTDAFLVHLRLLAQSYRQLALFCEAMDKASRVKKPATDGVAGSELEAPGGEKVTAWYPRNYYLCHGGAALKDVKVLGDPKGLHAALDFADKMIEKHQGTPWELQMRRASVPVFYPLFEQKPDAAGAGRSMPRPTAKSSSTQAGTETPGSPQRPARGSGGESGRGSGTSTGGGNK